MKTIKNLFMLMVALLVTVSFASCSDDENDNGGVPSIPQKRLLLS